MHPQDDPATTELRRWALERAAQLCGKFDAPQDVLEMAQDIEKWVLRSADDKDPA